MALKSLFIDFNSYFASVEQQIKPELRNRPVGVLPVLSDTTCCIAASYEAKAYGVRTGTMVSEAKKLCPDMLFVEANHKTYIQYHKRLVDVIDKQCLPVDKVLSIDEMICTLIGNERKRDNAINIALLIKKKIREEVGEYLRCSIGIAPNLFLAKMGTNMQKPDGLVVIDDEDLPQCLYKLEISDIYGVGRRMEVRLRRNGIYTMEDLCKADRNLMRKVWGGIEGERMYDQLRGKDVPRPLTHRSTIGHSHVLPPKLKSNASAYAVLQRLVQKAGMRLRYLGYYAGALGVAVRYKIKIDPYDAVDSYNQGSRGSGKRSSSYIEFLLRQRRTKWRDSITFIHTQNTTDFIKALDIMWKRNPFTEDIPTAVSVVLFNLLQEKYATLPVLESYRQVQKNKSLYTALDGLNKRYGYASVYFGGSHIAKYSAPMRIAFTQIPDLEVEDDDKKIVLKRKR